MPGITKSAARPSRVSRHQQHILVYMHIKHIQIHMYIVMGVCVYAVRREREREREIPLM